jgi:hypothetical protein
MKDRRSAARGRVNWPVTLETFEGRVIHGEVVDASTSGVRVLADEELAVGTGVTLTVILPRGADRLEVVARVARPAPDGIALDFVGLPQTEARRVRNVMASWEPRRRAPRVDARLPIELVRARGRAVAAHLVDLSAFGAKVGAEEALRAGERLGFRLAAVDGGGLSLDAIVWDLTPRGTILLFVNLREPDFRRLWNYLTELQRRAPAGG